MVPNFELILVSFPDITIRLRSVEPFKRKLLYETHNTLKQFLEQSLYQVVKWEVPRKCSFLPPLYDNQTPCKASK